MSTCQSCHAPVLWALTEAGKRMPLNADPDPAGTVVAWQAANGALSCRGLRKGERPQPHETRYTSPLRFVPAGGEVEATMNPPYYQDEQVILYHGDCREITEWLSADVLVTDPPYGIGWSQPQLPHAKGEMQHVGIANDADTSDRDYALEAWGSRPALVFGSLRAVYPMGWRRMLVFEKPTVGSGIIGQRVPWLANWEPIFMLGEWPDQTPTRSAVIRTRSAAASGYSGYTTKARHPHAKPLDVMTRLIEACPLGVVVDPFAGSGSTLVAAKALGRRCIGVEIEERYCEIAAKRLSQDVLDFGAPA